MFNVVTLPEPMRLRDFDANEDRKLSDFQEELVQLAASLKGDLKIKDKPIEGMTVARAAEYSNEAFKVFMDECAKAKENGAAEDSVVVVETTEQEQQQEIITSKHNPEPKSFVQRLFSCSGW